MQNRWCFLAWIMQSYKQMRTCETVIFAVYLCCPVTHMQSTKKIPQTMSVPTIFNYRDFLFTSLHYHIVTRPVKLELSLEAHSVITFLKHYPNHLVFPSVRCCSQRPIIKRCVYLTVVISLFKFIKSIGWFCV